MAFRISAGLAQTILTSGLAAAFDGGTARINIYSGAQPATAATAASGTLLGTLTPGSDAMAAPSANSVAFNAIAADSSADATGTAGCYRVYLTGDTAPGSAGNATDRRMDGNITATGGGGDMTLDSVSVVLSAPINITSFTITLPIT